MVKMNLIPPKRKRQQWVAPLIIAGCALFLIGIFSPRQATFKPSAGVLGVEEREAVLFAISLIEEHHPKLVDLAAQLEDDLLGGSLPALNDPLCTGKDLVHLTEEAMVFSPAFFSADSVSQERALMNALVARSKGLKPGKSDLSISKK